MSQARADANRANARRSTGPRTAEGKARASKNAVRHGLNAAPDRDTYSAEVTDLASRLGGEAADAAARVAAESELFLIRIRMIKQRLLEAAIRRVQADPGRDRQSDPEAVMARALLESTEELRRLDGYERKARSRRKRAFRELWS